MLLPCCCCCCCCGRDLRNGMWTEMLIGDWLFAVGRGGRFEWQLGSGRLGQRRRPRRQRRRPLAETIRKCHLICISFAYLVAGGLVLLPLGRKSKLGRRRPICISFAYRRRDTSSDATGSFAYHLRVVRPSIEYRVFVWFCFCFCFVAFFYRVFIGRRSVSGERRRVAEGQGEGRRRRLVDGSGQPQEGDAFVVCFCFPLALLFWFSLWRLRARRHKKRKAKKKRNG